MQKVVVLFLTGLLTVSPLCALVRNGGFEEVREGKTIPGHWSLATAFTGSVDGNAAEGKNSFKLNGPGGTGILIQSLKLKPGKTYTLTWQVKAEKPEQKFRLYIEYSTFTKRFAGTRWGSGYAGTKWEKHSLTFSLPDDVRSSTLVLRQAKGSGAVWFDDFKLVESLPVPNAPDVSRERFIPKAVPIRNAGFEKVGKNGLPAHWSTPNGAGKIDGNAAEGKNAIMLNKDGGNGIFIQSVKFLPGKTYTVSYQVKAAHAAQKYSLYVEYSTFTKRFAGAFWGSGTAGTKWEKRSFSFTMPKDVKYSTLVLRQVKSSGTIWFDDFTVREETAVKKDTSVIPRKADTVLNPGFEQQLAGWECDKPATVKLDTSNAKGSKTSLLLTEQGTVKQRGIPVARNTGYRLTVNVMCSEFNHPYRFFVGWDPVKSAGGDHGGISQKFGLERQDGFTAWQTKSIEFTTPVKPFSSMYITLENLAPGKVWFDNVTLEKIDRKEKSPLEVTLESPAYRNTFYASQPVREISGKIKFNRPVKFPADVIFELTGSDGKKISLWDIRIGKNGDFFRLPFDSSLLADGKYSLRVTVKQTGKEIFTAALPVRKVKKAGYEVLPDKNNMLRINGKTFFPVGLYEPDFTEEDFARYQRFGFNTVLYMSSNAPSIKLVADKAHQYGLKVVSHYVHEDNEVTQHPAFLAYHNADEPAWMGSDCATLVKKYRQMTEIDPYHPVWMNHAPRNDIATLKMYNEGCDISGVDIYPVTASARGSDHSDLDDRTISCVGKYAVKMRRSVDERKPIIMVLQGFAWGHLRSREAKNARYPDYRETRFMVWDSIIHGAAGVFYYATNRMRADHRLWLDMAKVNHEVQALAAVITAPAGEKCLINAPLVAAATRNFGGNQVIFMENTSNKPQKATVTFPAFRGKCFELYKKSPVAVENGKFEVQFTPYEVKIFSAEPLPTLFDPAKEYTFGKTQNIATCKEIPFDDLGTGVMGYNWRGSWIWSSARPFAPKVYLRKKFNLSGSAKSAHIAISADASYRLFVNGKEVGKGACCWMAQHYDLTGFFKPGENLIAVEGTGDGGPTGVLFEGKISTGSHSEYFISDASWKCSSQAGENWNQNDFDDSRWYPAIITYPVDKGVWGRIPIVP